MLVPVEPGRCLFVCVWGPVVVLSLIMILWRHQGEFKATTDRGKNNLHNFMWVEGVVAMFTFYFLFSHNMRCWWTTQTSLSVSKIYQHSLPGILSEFLWQWNARNKKKKLQIHVSTRVVNNEAEPHIRELRLIRNQLSRYQLFHSRWKKVSFTKLNI